MKQWVKSGIEGVKGYYFRPRMIAPAYALAAFVVLLVVWLYVGNLAEDRLSLEERTQVTHRVNTIGTSLTMAVNQRLTLVTSIRSFMEAEITREPDFGFVDTIEKEEIDNFVSGLYDSVVGIRNIAIAPDGVMQFVYPYDENKSVLGYEPARDGRPNVREEVQRAIQTGEVVLSLPYDLIQGGQGLIARQAINVDGRYWGLANVVLDLPPLLEEAGVIPMPAGLELALRDQSGMIFVGSENVFDIDPVIYEVELPEGSWYLAAVPAAGWGMSYRALMRLYNGLGLIVTVAISIIIYLFIHRREWLSDLVDRRTQELTQSNQTLINVLEGIDTDVYVADFATNEILFANKHLCESFKDELVGNICYQVFRHEATVCAHCKNNLLLDMNGKPTGVLVWEDYNPITEKWYKNADRAIRWHTGNYVHLQIATDITEQKRTLAAISESEERYRQAVENSPNPIFSISRKGIIQTWNQACERVFQYDQSVVGQHYHILLRNAEEQAAVELLLNKVLSGQSLSNVNMVYQRKDEGECFMVSRIYPLCNHREEVQGYVFANTDVTQQKRADDELKMLLQEKDILLAEVHHRVKNNMQVIISLLGLQANEIGDEHFKSVYEESRNRIRSMSLVHEQLYRSNEFARIEFGSYIDQLATSLFNTYQIDPDRVQLIVTTNGVYIDLERAIPCGLLLNELITNSLKYAFPNGREGHIWIEIKPEADHMILTFDDDGIGLPVDVNLEEPQSLGLQLVRLLTVHDLHGRIEIRNGYKKGVRFKLEFPAPGLNNGQEN